MSDLLVWVVALPLLGAIATVAWPRQGRALGVATALATLGAALGVLAQVMDGMSVHHELGGWSPGLGIGLAADGMAAAFLAMTAVVALAVSIHATAYFAPGSRREGFWPLWLLLWAALNALYLSADLFNLYVTLELLGMAAVALAALGGGRAALEAAMRYLVVGLVGSLGFLGGVAILYLTYGSLHLGTLAAALEANTATWGALVLMTTGVLAKAALFPLHFWLPPAHANAPAPVSAALSALVVKAAAYLVMRLWLDLFGPAVTPAAGMVLGTLGAGAVLWGSWQALRAARLKLLAAYSTVAQLGYLFMFMPLLMVQAPGPARDAALGGLVAMALSHGFAKGALFLAAGAVQQHAGHDRIRDLGGTARALPATTFTIALAGVALIGLPPSGAFLGKWQLMAGAIDAGQWFWIPVVLAGSLLAAAYVFRLLGHAFGRGEHANAPFAITIEAPALVLALLATAALGLGAAPLWPLVGGLGAPS